MPTNHDDMIDSLDLAYAQTLLELAEEAGSVDQVADEMGQLGELAHQNPDLVRLISTRTLSMEQRACIIERLLRRRVSDLVYRFVQVANAKDRLARLEAIAKALETLLEQRRGVVRVEVFVAEAMEPSRVDSVAQRLGQALGGKKVLLEQNVQPDLIGGLKLRIGDRLIDGSVATQLRLMRQKMVSTGRDNARQKLERLIVER